MKQVLIKVYLVDLGVIVMSLIAKIKEVLKLIAKIKQIMYKLGISSSLR